jgi:O-antigen/teichoic acid export membrane protein
VMLGISRHKPVVPVAIAEGLCNLALSIILVRKIGIIGVAWGTVIPNMATSIFFWPWYVRKTLGVPIGEYARKAWLLPTASLIPFAICSYLVGRFAPAPNLLIFFVQVAALLPVAAVGAWYIGLNRAERETYGPHLMTPLFRAVRRT